MTERFIENVVNLKVGLMNISRGKSSVGIEVF